MWKSVPTELNSLAQSPTFLGPAGEEHVASALVDKHSATQTWQQKGRLLRAALSDLLDATYKQGCLNPSKPR